MNGRSKKCKDFLLFLFMGDYRLQLDQWIGMDGEQMDLSVVIPMFNEAENAERTIQRVDEVLAQFGGSYEIIPVNDGSTDGTLEVLKGIAGQNGKVKVSSYPKNAGRGKALRRGFKESVGEVIVSIDADLSYGPGYILDLVDVLRNDPDID